jgi:inosose dehydratase
MSRLGPRPTRRHCLRLAALSTVGFLASRPVVSEPPVRRDGCTLSIGTYSLRGMALEEAIALVAEIGYDGIEIATQPGFDGEPDRLPPARRAELRQRLDASGLRLTALMEQITPSADEAQRRDDVGRLQRVFDLAHALAPGRPPLVQTVLGGGRWDEKKGLFRDRLAEWRDAASACAVVLAIKPHRGGALSRPDEAAWLFRQLGDSRWLRMVYDYSHYASRDMPLEETVRTALPYTAHIAVKDAVAQGSRVVFALPGESGTFDYARLLRLFHEGGYRGDVCCEVSSMVSGRPGYDPSAAAKTCYANMARAFERANVPRA